MTDFIKDQNKLFSVEKKVDSVMNINDISKNQQDQQTNDVKSKTEPLIIEDGVDNSDFDLFEFLLEKEQIKKYQHIIDLPKSGFSNLKHSEQININVKDKEIKSNVNLTARNISVSMNFKQVERKFIGHLTRKGERSKAVKIWLRFLVFLKRHFYNSTVKYSVQEIILTVINIIKPIVILKERKIAGTVYQIPYFVQNVNKDNSTLIAIRWFIEAMHLRLENDPAERLYKEFLDVLNFKGICYKKKQDIYAIAIKNRVYAKFLFIKSGRKRNI